MLSFLRCELSSQCTNNTPVGLVLALVLHRLASIFWENLFHCANQWALRFLSCSRFPRHYVFSTVKCQRPQCRSGERRGGHYLLPGNRLSLLALPTASFTVLGGLQIREGFHFRCVRTQTLHRPRFLLPKLEPGQSCKRITDDNYLCCFCSCFMHLT